MTRTRLYLVVILACTGGLIWSIYQGRGYPWPANSSPSVCLFKNITQVPCPSCGSTRAVGAFFSGDLQSSLLWNPFGIVIALIMVISPLWILYDVMNGGDSFLKSYHRIENWVRHKRIAALMILLVLINWIWNIQKGL